MPILPMRCAFLAAGVSGWRTCGAHVSRRGSYQRSFSSRQFTVTLDGETLYIDKELAEALGWREGGPTEGVPLRLSGWSPHYFAITQKGTDAGE